jgi:hypothetical protein
MRFVLALVLGFLLFGAGLTRAQIQPAQGFDKTAMDATFALYARGISEKTGKMQQIFVCSAFVFKRDATGYFLLSMGHCVYDMPSEVTFVVSEQIGGPFLSVVPVSARLNGSEEYSEFHLTTTKIYPVLEVGDDSSEYIGSIVLTPNFAFGIGKQLARGVVASQRLSRTDECHDCDGEFLVHETAGEGASGSPVISATTHKVVGVLEGEWQGQNGEFGGFFVEPIATIQHSLTLPNQYNELHRTQPLDFRKIFGAPNAN